MTSVITAFVRRLGTQPLRRQLGLAVLLSLVSAVTVVVWTGATALRDEIEKVGDEAQIISVTSAAYALRYLADIESMARTVTAAPFVTALDIAASQEMMKRLPVGRPDILAIVLVDREGTELVRVDSEEALVFGGDPPGLALALSSGERSIALLEGGTPAQFVHWYPILRTDSVVGAMGFFLSLETLGLTFDQLPLPAGAFLSVTDTTGRIMAHSAPEVALGTMVGAPSAPDDGTPLSTRRPNLDGVEHMVTEVSLAPNPFAVRVGIPTSVAFDRAFALWTRSGLVLVLGLVVWLGIALLLARRLTQSVGHLDTAAQRIAGGDLSPVELRPMPSREFAELQDAFAQMVRRLHESRLKLDQQVLEERGVREEVESLQSQVIRQERLAAVGQLVSGVAHEINNPLQSILGFAELLQMGSDLPEAAKKDLVLIQKESNRACAIIRNLATFARQESGEAVPVRLSSIVSSVAELRQHRLDLSNIVLRLEDESQKMVRAVSTELQQVVLNFVVNAEQAIQTDGRGPGRIVIRTRDDGDRVVLEVEDSGPGIKPEDEARLFEPFFTTKPVGQGTGLGLSVSYGIIESMGGHLGYRRAKSGSAIFFFELPAVRPDATPDPK